MKKLFDEDEDENLELSKAKVLVKVIPFVLVILILGITLLVNSIKKNNNNQTDDLQKDIMEYADANQSAQTVSKSVAESSPSAAKEEREEEVIPSPTPYKEGMEAAKTDYSKIQFDKDAQLKEMMTYWEDNNQKALDDLANLDRFIAMSWKLKGTSDFYYYGDTNGNGEPDGKGIAVYADNQYYYGDWKDGVRSGNGTWMHYHIHQDKNTKDLYTYHQYTGNWKNDLPDGEGSEHYDYNQTLLKKGVGYNTNLIGSYLEGLVDGEFYLTNLYLDGSTKEWNAEAERGSWIYRSENKDKNGNRTVYVEVQNPDNYIWMQPKDNINIGVSCLISKNKI